MLMSLDDMAMQQCFTKAWQYQTLTLPNPAVAALIYDEKGEILSLQAHQKAGLPHAEVLALFWAFVRLYAKSTPLNTPHAQILAITPLWEQFQATHKAFSTLPLALLPTNANALHEFLLAYHNDIFCDKTIVLTLEPCNHTGKTPPCASLLAQLRPKRVYIAARDEWGESAGGAKMLQHAGIQVDIATHPLIQKQATELLYPFLCYKRDNQCVLYKLASRLDGSYDGDISGKHSRIFTHNQRSIATSIIVSGATWRNDSPLLNARLARPPYDAAHIPHIGIFTHDANIIDANANNTSHASSRTINIYNAHNLHTLPHGFHIIEGSLALYKIIAPLLATPPILLLHLSLSSSMTKRILNASTSPLINSTSIHALATDVLASALPHRFTLLHSMLLDSDLLLWLEPCDFIN